MVGVMNGSTSDIACMINSSVTCSQTCSATGSDKQNGSSSRKRRRDGSKKSCIAGCSFLQDTNCEWELEWSETFKEPVAAILISAERHKLSRLFFKEIRVKVANGWLSR